MNEHPILFSTPMVQANLDGRKSMTRRMTGLDKVNKDPDNWESIGTYHVITKGCFEVCFEHKKTKEKIYCHAQYGLPGDLLWVRETFSPPVENQSRQVIYYKADFSVGITEHPKNKGMWKPSIYMPKAAARIWVEVEEIRVERLNDINSQDAIHEGIENSSIRTWKDYLHDNMYCSNSIQSFKTLFISINGKPKPQREFGEKGKIVSYTAIAWDQKDFDTNWAKYHGEYRQCRLHVIINPWVWVIKYKVLSTTGKPEMCYKTGEVCKYDCKGLCRESM